MPASIEYTLTGSGWAECTVAIGSASVVVTASYLSDALGELAHATVDVLRGASEACLSFDEEPGEYRWILERSGDALRVTILSFSELWSNADDAEGTVILQGACTVTEFAHAVLRALDRILAVHGLAGYRDRWVEHEFPEALRAVLRSTLEPAGHDG